MSGDNVHPDEMKKIHEKRLQNVYGYDTWRGRSKLKENLFIWNLFLTGRELPNWNAQKVRPSHVKGWPPLIKSMWTPLEKTEKLLRMDIYECSNLLEAHNFLMRKLGDFESILLRCDEERLDAEIGDIAFMSHGGYCLLFSRANIVVFLASVGRDLESVIQYANDLDRQLIEKPSEENRFVLPLNIFRFEALTTVHRVDMPINLIVTPSEIYRQRLMYKFYSPGELSSKEGVLYYRPVAEGLQRISVIAISPEGGFAQQDLELDVK
jgi:hypothetical protein